MQKTQTNECGCPRKDRSETEGYEGAQTYLGIESGELVEVNFAPIDLLESILAPFNLNEAYKRVVANKGSGGIDKMATSELLPYLKLHGSELTETLRSGKYRPNPVRRVEMPKDNGKVRQLGIPTVVDRLIQQSIAQVLAPIYEPQFSDNSYGFRPNRSAHQALLKAEQWANEGYKWVIDLDLEKFFDKVNHSKLIEVLSRTIKDGRVVSLIHKYLNAGVMVGHKFEDTSEGVPQGGPLSPLLSNILLNELDKELSKRGHRFIRYADDCIIMLKSKRACERVLESVKDYIEGKLFLKVNMEKTQICPVDKMKFLGYSMYYT